jgi:hypothetical protein
MTASISANLAALDRAQSRSRTHIGLAEGDSRFPPPPGSVTAKPKSTLLRWHGDADPNADRAWLVRDLIPETGKGLIAGQWGTGKTFGALDLSASVMTGMSFANRKTERVGGVLFIAPEGAFEIPIRLRGLTECKLAQAVAEGVLDQDAATLLARLPFAWAEECPRLIDPGAGPALIEIAKAAQEHLREAFGLPLVLIIIDTVAAGAGFNDENSAAESQKVMDGLQALARETGAFVMGVDHFGKTSETGTRGSSAKESAADVVLAFLGTRDEGGTISNTRMALRKLRGGKVGMETVYDLDVVQVGETYHREPITTCVVNWQSSRGETIAQAVKDRWPKTLRVFRSALETALATSGYRIRPFGAEGPEVLAVVEDALREEFYASYVPAGEADPQKRAGAKQKAFKRAAKQASDAGVIASRELGGVDHLWMVTGNAT